MNPSFDKKTSSTTQAAFAGNDSAKKGGSAGFYLEDNRARSLLQMKSKVNIGDDTSSEDEAAVAETKTIGIKDHAVPLQRKSDAESVIQRNAIKVAADGLSVQMTQRFDAAYAQFSGTILAASHLATGANNHVVVHGVRTADGLPDYGSTTIYIGNNGYQGADYAQYTEMWSLNLANAIPQDVGIRIVIAVNLTLNRSENDLYATLLHEWYAHAEKWADAVALIRNGQSIAAIQATGHQARGQQEHIEYANWTDDEVEDKVNALNLGAAAKATVLNKLKADRDRHDKVTGNV